MDELDLAMLIRAARRDGEVSYDRLSKACGGRPSAQRLYQYESGDLKNFPDPATIQALSRGTGFSATEVIMASARSLNLPVTSQDPDMIRVHGISKVPARVSDLLRDLGREIVKLTEKEKERGGNVSTAPIAQAGESPAASDTDTTQDDVDLAAYETGQESQGRRLRRLQDEAAEGSQE